MARYTLIAWLPLALTGLSAADDVERTLQRIEGLCRRVSVVRKAFMLPNLPGFSIPTPQGSPTRSTPLSRRYSIERDADIQAKGDERYLF